MIKNKNLIFKNSIFRSSNLSGELKDFFISIFNKKHPDNYLKSEFIKNTFVSSSLFLITILLIVTGFFGYYGNSGNYVINDRLNLIGNSTSEMPPIGESNPVTNWANLGMIPANLRVVRAVFDLSIVWTLFFYLYSIKIGFIYIKRKAKLFYCLFSFLNLIPIFSLIFIIVNCSKNIDILIIKYQVNKFFSSEDFLLRQYRIGSKKRLLLLLEWIIYLPLIPILFISDYNNSQLNNWGNNFWFYTVSFFTLQGNMLVFLFVTLILFFPGWQIFKNNLFQIMATTYITIVTTVWCLILLPNFILTNTFPVSIYGKISTIWIHIVTPWTFIWLSIYLMKTTYKFQCHRNIFKTAALVIVYPLMYALYLIILPFNTGVSVYSWVTNLNPNLAIFTNYLDSGSNINFGKPIYSVFFILQEIIFVIIGLTYIVFNYKWVDRNSRKMNFN